MWQRSVWWFLLLVSPVLANPAPRELAASQIDERGDVVYERGQQQPFTGIVIGTHPNGAVISRVNYKDGVKHGESITWYEGGKMRLKSHYKNGERDGVWVSWDKNGQMLFQREYKDGSQVH